jgi:hypothetical protein
MRLPALRFSLRWLLLAGALIPAGLYWLALPTLNAQRYVAAINRGDWADADALCSNPERLFPGDWPRHETFHPTATLQPATWRDWRTGQRQLYVVINYGDGGGLAGCGLEATATRRGIEVGMLAP